jgi:glutathione-independent formaldehyde dehydrogenase
MTRRVLGPRMKAVVFQKPRELTVETVSDPEPEHPTDALIRITSSAICSTDLHIYEGRMGEPTGMVIGHEPLGVVEEVGPSVVSVKPGDRVTVPTHICCGFCASCVSGRSAECLMTNPGQAGAAYGYPGMGGYRGAQAELLRVPFADANCLRLPGEPGDQWEDDFVLLADAFPSGHHAAELAGVSMGDSVAVFGAGAIGLLAAYSARLRGAADVYVVDNVAERLDKAGEMGFDAIDFAAGDPVEQILERRRRMRGRSPAWRGEEPLIGVTCGIDAIGFQARDREDSSREHPQWVIEALAQLVHPGGRLGIIGVFVDEDPGASGELERSGRLAVPWGSLFKKGVTIGMGRDHDERYNGRLRDLIVTGRAKPSMIVSHHLTLDEAPGAYEAFDARSDGYLKIVLGPN